MSFDLKKKLAEIAKKGPNQQEAQKGGGDYTPPPEGACFLRLVGYVEIGKHRSTWQGNVKIKDKVHLVFELSGKNYPPTETDNGPVPARITVKETLSLSEKANFFKLFNAMRNGREDITHMAQMLGEGFIGRVYHSTFQGRDGKEVTIARLRNDAGYSIRPPYREDPETGESVKVRVPDAISQLRLFVWDLADKDMWDSLFIDGEYDDGRTKNVFQAAILEAENFEGSPIHQVLAGADGDDPEDEDAPEGPDDDAAEEPEDPPADEAPEAPAPKAKAAPKGKDKPKAAPKPKAGKPDPLAGIGDDDIPY